MRIPNRITGIEGVVQGGLATFSLPVGPRYHGLKLFTFVNGVAVLASTLIDKVRLKVNEITIRDLTAAQILAIAKLNGITPAVGTLPIFFSEPGRADKVDEVLTAWDTFGERSFKVELSIKTLALPTDVPLISGLKYFDSGATIVNGVRRKSIVKQLTQSFNAPAGQYDLDTFNTKYPMLRILLDGASGISYVEVNADSARVFESAVAENKETLADYGLDGTAFTFPVCFDFTEQLTDFLEVAKSLNVRVTSTAPQAIYAIQEMIAPGFE